MGSGLIFGLEGTYELEKTFVDIDAFVIELCEPNEQGIG